MLCIRWGLNSTGAKLGSEVCVSLLGGILELALPEVISGIGSEVGFEIRALTHCGSSQSKTTAPARRIVVVSIAKKADR
jgi:hypothetical protein